MYSYTGWTLKHVRDISEIFRLLIVYVVCFAEIVFFSNFLINVL